ncbi:MAG: hypothetical protein CM1200mP18_15820 [Gammaproteobacteria bacterium]|nr:MAG: hypothetical protein CM1200mP18_15820 [Gammaproteobacteria bacterium]
MADADTTEAKNYATSVPMQNVPFFPLKGANNLDWGMKNRLPRFLSDLWSHRHVGLRPWVLPWPDQRLERIDLNIVPLIEYADTLMLTRGILRTTIPPTYTRGIVLRASGGPSILKELSDEEIAVSIDEAVRLNVAAMAVQVFIGGEHETRSVHNMTRLVDMGNRHGIATLAVTAVGKEMVRDAQYMRLATRMCAELGQRMSRRTTLTKTSTRLPRRVQCRSSSLAARNFPSPRRYNSPTMQYNRAQPASIWVGTFSSQKRLLR